MKNLYEYISSNKKQLTLVAVGDILVHDCILNDSKFGDHFDFNHIFSTISPQIKKYDLAYCNQESPIGGISLGVCGGSYRPDPKFNSPEALGDAVANAGFNLISISNNHSRDLGIQQIMKSIEYWRTKPSVIVAGEYRSETERYMIPIHIKNGIKYAFLAYNTRTRHINRNGDSKYMLNIYDDKLVENDINLIRDKVDVIIVAMHWGEEYAQDISEEQRIIANHLASLGVDIILGSHSHTIQPIEWIGQTLVIYSLGNFLSFRDDVEMKRVGLMAKIRITIDGDKKHIKCNPDLTYIDMSNEKDFRVVLLNDPSLVLKNKDDIRKRYFNIIESV